MHSEFTQIPLDRLRYGLVWEDHRTLYRALDLGPADHALIITSAGCNALNALLAGPRQVTAIDLNPVQNQLLALKMHVIGHHPPAVLRGLLGLAGPAAVAWASAELQATLPADAYDCWAAYLAQHPAGLLLAGQLEGYVTGFLPTLPATYQARLRHLLTFDTVPAQLAYFEAELNQPGFRTRFIDYFDAANLSKGRDPRLYSYATEAGGATFFGRLRRHLGQQLARDNFFFRFLFFGPENIPEAILPPCYQAAHHARLRARLDYLQLVTGEATEFLLSAAGQSVTKASLSNIFEYVSAAEFGRVSRALAQRPQPLRAVFWNLLQAQAARRTAAVPLLSAASEALGAADGCFYFGGVRMLDYAGHEAFIPDNTAYARHAERSEASRVLH
jgi:S-adenosylmethionine-diacylglycerol 3-amino-3-carboxypropyl transferase